MDGISASLGAAATELSTSGVNTEAQVKILKEAIEQSGDEVLPFLEGLGENMDLTA